MPLRRRGKLQPRLYLAAAAVAIALIGAAQPKKSVSAVDVNWEHYGQSGDETHYSPLDQIDDKNVGKLGLAWSYDLDTFDSFTAPLEVDGVVYLAVGNSVIHALDARTGKLLWKYDPDVASQEAANVRMRAGWGIRGIAYKGGKIFVGTREGRLIAVSAKTGKPIWSVQTLDDAEFGYISGPPWVAGNKVVIGFGGGEYEAVRGYVTAYDINTGKKAWRFYTVPGDPSKGFEDKAQEMAAKTWSGQWWKLGGGGTVWHAMAYDARFNQLLLGVGNAEPWNDKIRNPGAGSNLFSNSIVALDPDTGAYKWHYQAGPNSSWDFDEDTDIELTDLEVGGTVRPVIIHASKNGFFYVIDRQTGKLLSAEKFAAANWASKIDLATGLPVENPDAHFKNGKAVLISPWPTGAHSVQSMAYSPKTRLAYIPVIEGSRAYVDPPDIENWQYKHGMMVNTGLGAPPPSLQGPPPRSLLLGWDTANAKPRWGVPLNGVINGGIIATGGNLIFQGQNTGEFTAFAADTGQKLWSFNAQNGILGNAITYTVGGVQYVTVITGFRSSFANKPNWDYTQQKRRVLTFRLGGQAKLPKATFADLPIQDDPKFAIDPKKAAIGAGIYNSSCVICHGAGMISGGAAPDLRKSAVPLDADAFKAVVHDGVLMPRGMGRFSQLSDEQLEGLRNYIRQRARETMQSK